MNACLLIIRFYIDYKEYQYRFHSAAASHLHFGLLFASQIAHRSFGLAYLLIRFNLRVILFLYAFRNF